MGTNWLNDLAKDSPGDFETTVELDIELSYLAFCAKRDENASWRLLGILAWKIERFVQRFRSWDLAPFDLEDVTQEAYLVFIDTIRRWQPSSVNRQFHGYLYYFFTVFPQWLANAVRRWRRTARPAVVRTARPRPVERSDDSVVDDFCRNLGPQETTLLKLRISRGLTVPDAARTMGLARRTAYRRWNRILEVGREYLREAG